MLSTVYVPAVAHPLVDDIAPGSGIVGQLQDDGELLLDFEGNLIGAPGLERYANRVMRAASRQTDRYPTRARRLVPPSLVVAIGEFDAREQVIRLTGPEAERELAKWHGCREHKALPKTNRVFWSEKIAANIARDERVNKALDAAGWLVLRFWEHDDSIFICEVVDRAVRGRAR